LESHFLLESRKTLPEPISVFDSALTPRKDCVMSQALVAATPIKLPRELLWFFDDPPLVGNETSEQYEIVFAATANAVEPRDVIAWLFVKDIVDLAWETRRERIVKTQIIKNWQKEIVGELSNDSFLGNSPLFNNAAAKANSWENDANARQVIDQELRKKGHSPFSILAMAYERGANQIDAIDKRIASYELRRILIIREANIHCERLARRLDKLRVDAIDGEFAEAAE
jgi:hypothetical protein